MYMFLVDIICMSRFAEEIMLLQYCKPHNFLLSGS